MTVEVQGFDLRIERGDKFPGDLVMKMRNSRGQWVPVRMELTFAMVDFLAENERERGPYVSYWTENGDRYFINQLVRAWREGWRVVADDIRAQRDRRRAS